MVLLCPLDFAKPLWGFPKIGFWKIQGYYKLFSIRQYEGVCEIKDIQKFQKRFYILYETYEISDLAFEMISVFFYCWLICF